MTRQIRVEGADNAKRKLDAKRRYVARLSGRNSTGLLVDTATVSQSLAIARDTLTKLPGSPRYPLRWKSDKQRKFVMAKLRRMGGPPYMRSGRIRRGWKSEINPGEVLIVNEARDPESGKFYGEYVFGKDQQPFHKDTGWTKESDSVTRQIVRPIVDSIGAKFKRGIRTAT